MPKARSKRVNKRRFKGNRYTKIADENIPSASESKLKDFATAYNEAGIRGVPIEFSGNRIIDLPTLISIFSILCCPFCFSSGLKLSENSRFGLCSNFSLKCTNCDFTTGFSTSPKVRNCNVVNTLLVFGLRLIGRGYDAGKKLCATLNLPFLSKCSFRQQEKTLLSCMALCAEDNMNQAAKEVRELKNDSLLYSAQQPVLTKKGRATKKKKIEVVKCGVSIDGTWQRRGHSSLNSCASAISVDTGKVLDVDILSQYCRACKNSSRYAHSKTHSCSNHTGSSGSMEVTSAQNLFQRSENHRQLQYSQYYGDGDSKGFMVVKDTYGTDSVEKLECIGHVQKRVGGRLRKLKKRTKGLGGKGKLTVKFINKLQNYYGIAVRSNVGNLQNMQRAVIAAFFHSCSGKNNQMHGQCPTGLDSWCKYQRAKFAGVEVQDKSSGLPTNIINIIKPVYMQLCDQELLKKCLHRLTQNNNESFNGVVWNIIPKNKFVEIDTLRLGVYISVILFNSGYAGLIPLFNKLKIPTTPSTLKVFQKIDCTRIKDCKRHSLPSTKQCRKKRRSMRKSKAVLDLEKEGTTYDYGGFPAS